MITINKRQASKLKAQGKLKPTKETVIKQRDKQVAKDISKAVTALQLTSKSIDSASTKISNSMLKLAKTSLKLAINTKEPIKKKKYTFTVLRDQRGFIKTVEVTEI